MEIVWKRDRSSGIPLSMGNTVECNNLCLFLFYFLFLFQQFITQGAMAFRGIASFSLTTILYGSAHKRISEYNTFHNY